MTPTHVRLTNNHILSIHIYAHLQAPTKVRALVVQGKGKKIMASLSDEKGNQFWTEQVHGNGTAIRTNSSTYASSITIAGFEQLCEMYIGIMDTF